MSRIQPIVEGHGEEEALPLLIRRINEGLPEPFWTLGVERPIRQPADRLRRGGLEPSVQLATKKLGASGAILILLDCEDGCPATEGPALLERAQRATPLPVSVVLAYREYESWFLASGERLDHPVPFVPHFEARRDAKGMLSQALGSRYSETQHQAKLTQQLDLALARTRSDSLDKCCREVERLIAVLRT